MSDTQDIEARLLGRPPGPGWGRPPTGVWPPCPPGPPGPWPGGLFRLEQCWDDVKATRALLTRIIKDILADDPSIIGLAQPIIGVTDGSEAQPGQVGQWVRFEQELTLATGTNTQVISMGVLPPGDWNISASAYTSAAAGTAAALFYVNAFLAPAASGFSDRLLLLASMPTPADSISITSSLERALISAPSLIAFSVETGVSTAGTMWLIFAARRMR